MSRREPTVAELALAAWADHKQQLAAEVARDAATSARRLEQRLRAILPSGAEVEVRTEPSLLRAGYPAAVAELQPHGLAVELPHAPSNRAGAMYALVLCPQCDQQVPAATGAPVETLADLGRAIEAGPEPHRPGPRVKGGHTLDPEAPCPGGAPDPQDVEEFTPAAALAGLLEAMVDDAVGRRLEGILG